MAKKGQAKVKVEKTEQEEQKVERKRGRQAKGDESPEPGAPSPKRQALPKDECQRVISKLKYDVKQGVDGAQNLLMKYQNSDSAGKMEFLKAYKISKNFTSIKMSEQKTEETSDTLRLKEGWTDKFFIAKECGIPLDSPFLALKLQKYQQKPHSDPEWEALGEKEYYYISDQLLEKATGSKSSTVLDSVRDLNTSGKTTLTLTSSSSGLNYQRPQLALENDPNIKPDPDLLLKEDISEAKKTLLKQTNMASKEMEVLKRVKAQMEEKASQKEYEVFLKPMLQQWLPVFAQMQESCDSLVGWGATLDSRVASQGLLEEIVAKTSEATAIVDSAKNGLTKTIKANVAI